MDRSDEEAHGADKVFKVDAERRPVDSHLLYMISPAATTAVLQMTKAGPIDSVTGTTEPSK
jgi:hypothetical protein